MSVYCCLSKFLFILCHRTVAVKALCQEGQLTLGLHCYCCWKYIGLLLTKKSSVLYVQSVPITHCTCTIHPPCERTEQLLHITGDITSEGGARCRKVSGHPQHTSVCALAGAQQHLRPATSPSPFEKIALFVKKCVWLAEACELRQTSDWLAAKTHWLKYIFYLNHFSQGNLICSIWMVNEAEHSNTFVLFKGSALVRSPVHTAYCTVGYITETGWHIYLNNALSNWQMSIIHMCEHLTIYMIDVCIFSASWNGEKPNKCLKAWRCTKEEMTYMTGLM